MNIVGVSPKCCTKKGCLNKPLQQWSHEAILAGGTIVNVGSGCIEITSNPDLGFEVAIDHSSSINPGKNFSFSAKVVAKQTFSNLGQYAFGVTDSSNFTNYVFIQLINLFWRLEWKSPNGTTTHNTTLPTSDLGTHQIKVGRVGNKVVVMIDGRAPELFNVDGNFPTTRLSPFARATGFLGSGFISKADFCNYCLLQE